MASKNGDMPSISPPASIEAEEAVLGSILIDPDLIYELKGYLEEWHFYREINRWVYKAMLALAGRDRPIDIVTMEEELNRAGCLKEIGGVAYIIGLVNAVPTSINGREYAGIVIDSCLRRKMLQAARSIVNLARDEPDIHEVISQATEQFTDSLMVRPTNDTLSLAELVPGVVGDVEDRWNADDIPGVPTGFSDLDKIVGIEPPDLIYTAGRPGMGKTALMLCLALNIAKLGFRPAIFNWEMTPEQLVMRLLAIEGEVDLSRMRKGSLSDGEKQRIFAASGALSELPIYISGNWLATPGGVESECRRLMGRGGLDLVMIDYLQLMTTEKYIRDKTERIGEISRRLKLMARSLNTVVMANSQLNRSLENRKDKTPRLADLRDSGSLEQDADHVWFVANKGYYDDGEFSDKTELNIAKQRNGPTGLIELAWQPASTRFYTIQSRPLHFGGRF